MIAARKASARAYSYAPGDLVKISTHALPLRTASTQASKLQHKWIGPFSVVEEVNPGAIRVQLPDSYSQVHDTFSVDHLRPWLSHDSHVLYPHFPAVRAHPSLNPVVQILDRKRYGRAPRDVADYLDIPTQYLVLLRNGDTEWRPRVALEDPRERRLVARFELRFPRDASRPCCSVSSYDVSKVDDDWESEDEVDIGLGTRLGRRGYYA
jgi:hypothetical protein